MKTTIKTNKYEHKTHKNELKKKNPNKKFDNIILKIYNFLHFLRKFQVEVSCRETARNYFSKKNQKQQQKQRNETKNINKVKKKNKKGKIKNKFWQMWFIKKF